MTTDTKKLEKIEKELEELRKLVANLIPYDENELDPEYRKELERIREEEPVEEYQPNSLAEE